jgi:hypothetical protein
MSRGFPVTDRRLIHPARISPGGNELRLQDNERRPGTCLAGKLNTLESNSKMLAPEAPDGCEPESNQQQKAPSTEVSGAWQPSPRTANICILDRLAVVVKSR